MNRKSWTERTKRFLPCFCAAIAILICIFALPTEVDAASESDLEFCLSDDGTSYCVSDCSSNASGALVIPSTYNGLPVTSIGDDAFRDCTSLTSITIPDSVQTIGEYTFSNCDSLESVTIGNSVQSIGRLAFEDCTSLTSVTIGNSVETIGEYAFYYCINLTSITIPDSVEFIGEHAFSYCSLESVTIGNNVQTIGERAFYYCISLTSITIPDSVQWIGKRAFEACTSLTSVTIGDGVQTIGDYAFISCDSLTSVTIPGSVKTIGGGAFYGCASLTSITIPDSVQTIGNFAFSYCTSLTSITIPDSVESMGQYAFENCTSLTSVTIGDSVERIGHGTFYGCDSLTSITIPDSVETIGEGAFAGCTSLTDVYYGGAKNQWESMSVGEDNDDLLNANIHFKGAAIDPLTAPKISVSGETISWAAVANADSYEVYRATSKSGKYSKVATITDLSYTDSADGKTYYYKVKAVYSANTKFNSGYSNVVSVTFKLDAPVVSVENDAKGKPKLSWAKVSGAKKYTVYRSTSENGKYSKLGTTTKTYYTDSKASAGNTYFYKVVANASKSTYNSGYSNIVSCGVICGTPTVTVKINTTTGKPSLSWGKVSGAAKYAVYRDGELLATVTAVTYADTTAAIDTQYTYAVQALGKTEELNGAVSKAVTATSGIAKPDVKGSINAASGKPVLSWEAVEGAVKYEVYRSTKSNKSYKLIATVETTSYEDAAVSAGKTYYYQVKAIGQVSKSALSTYDKLTGKCATPELFVENAENGKPCLKWYKVSGAKKYTIYRATSETGKYTKLGTTTKLTYTDTKASVGKVYYYKIVANASSSKYNSGYSNIVSCGCYCGIPVVKISNNAAGKVTLSWSKISGAVKYEIYLLGADDYVTLGVVTGTSWTDTEAGIGEGRYYGVRAIAANEDYNSEVSEPVFGRTTCATPKITGKVGANRKPIISWGAVEGATKYIIYRSTSSSKGFTVIGETEDLSWEDLTAKKGKTYYYKVVAVGEGYQSIQSNYVKIKSK